MSSSQTKHIRFDGSKDDLHQYNNDGAGTQRSSIATDAPISRDRKINSPNADEAESNRRLKHWEGSQTKLAYIKRELKRSERSAIELKE